MTALLLQPQIHLGAQDLAIATVKHEDFELGARMQRGFMSGLQAEVIYGRNEPGLINFHERLAAALA